MADPGPLSSDPSRLNGWKDIANYLDKGVRTAQRWEKQYGLPVHRIGEEGGEIVYAFRHEVDAWLLTSARARANDRQAIGSDDGPLSEKLASGSQPSPVVGPPFARRFPKFFVAGAGLVLAVAAALAYLGWPGDRPLSPSGSASRSPSSWKVDHGTLRVFDAEGRELWIRHLEGSGRDEDYGQQVWPSWSVPIAIADLDGDGPREVIVKTVTGNRESAATLRCFSADGTQRWQRRLDDRVRFGQDTYSAPWLVYHFTVRPNPDGTRAVWVVFIHNYLFPSVLEQIDPQGAVRSRYWSNGYITSLNEGTWKGRPVLLVGAANNEHKSASLAVLDAAAPTATAPAAKEAYRCGTCPAREPDAFVVFPPSSVTRARGEANAIGQAWATDGDGLVAQTVDVDARRGVAAPLGDITYALDARLRPVAASISKAYLDVYDSYVASGRIDHPYAPERDSRLGPVLKWENGRFVETGIARAR